MNRSRSIVFLLIAALAAPVLGAAPASAAEASGEIVVVGGPAAVSTPLADHLAGCTGAGVERLAGSDRYATAAAIAGHWATADTVFLSTGLAFPDAIAGGPAAGLNDAPMLLTDRDFVPGSTAAALARLAPRRVVLLGGTGAISTTVEDVLRASVPEVVRLAGADRYATAAAISAWQFPTGAPVVYVATGQDYVDALVAGPMAVRDSAPLLLVARDTVPASTLGELTRLSPGRIVIVGGTGVVGATVEARLAGVAPVSRVAGSTLAATARAAAAGAPGSKVFVATADAFPDGLAAIPLTGGAPIVLVQRLALDGVTAGVIAGRTGTPCSEWSPPYPQVGSGKRIIYANAAQRVWLIDEQDRLVDTYLVSGRQGRPYPGTYSVYSKSLLASAGHAGITMRWMVRFVPPGVSGNRLAIGFHAIPRYANGTPMQTEAQLGTFQSAGCVRQADPKAEALYAWAPIGTTVIVLP